MSTENRPEVIRKIQKVRPNPKFQLYDGELKSIVDFCRDQYTIAVYGFLLGYSKGKCAMKSEQRKATALQNKQKLEEADTVEDADIAEGGAA